MAIPYGTTAPCPMRTVGRWHTAAGITNGPLFRRIFAPLVRTHGGRGSGAAPVVGTAAIDPGTVGRILKQRAGAAGFDPDVIRGHSLERGALSTGMHRGIHRSMAVSSWAGHADPVARLAAPFL